MSRIAPRLVSVLVTGDDLDGFTDAAPTSHLKVFLPADGQDAPNLPEFAPDGVARVEDAPPPTVRTYTPRRYDPAPRRWRSSSCCTAKAPRRSGRSGPSPATSSRSPARAAGSPSIRRRTTGGSPPTSPRSRPSAPCSTPSRRPSTVEVHIEVDGPDDEIEFAGPAKTSVTWHHRRDPARSAPSWPRPPARRTSPTAPGSGWPARRPRCATSAATSPASGASRSAQLVTRGYWRAGEQNHPDHDYGED